jgi:hypothetical protein
MPQKILRLGLSESTLLFIFWCEHHQKMDITNITDTKISILHWLYTTSGYYDKNMIGNYFNVSHKKDPDIYIKYMNTVYNFLLNSNYLSIAFHCLHASVHEQLNEFKNGLNARFGHISQEIVFDFIRDKNILIISPFSPLIKHQIISENCKKIYSNTPNIKNVYIYKNAYTFFNNGIDNNILETTNSIIEDIKKKDDDYDSVLISCGAYSNLIAKELYENGKNVLTIGADLQKFFGILNNREKGWNFKPNNEEYWITQIPDEYKPEGYEKIEKGCYW